MDKYEVTHATPDGFDLDRRIDLIGGPDLNGGWAMTQEDAIRFVLNNPGALYVVDRRSKYNPLMTTPSPLQSAFSGQLNRVAVIVKQKTVLSRLHLATEADGVFQNNLESLPPVPAHYRLVPTL